jgi:hypothetical protein
MLDRHEAHDDRNTPAQDLPHRDAAGNSPLADRPLADREVPLPAWPPPTIRRCSPSTSGWTAISSPTRVARMCKQVAMWSRVAVETDQRRRMTTPAHVAANIMAALPAKETAKSVTAEAAKATSTATFADAAQSAGMSMPMVLTIGAVLFAVGIVVGKMLL